MSGHFINFHEENDAPGVAQTWDGKRDQETKGPTFH